MRGPAACVQLPALVEQVEGLLGRPLASVEGIDFEIEIAAGAQQKWRLRVDTIDRSEGHRRTRQLSGQSCAELADAAAVAIAMSVTSSGDDANQAPAESVAAAPDRAPSPPPPQAPAMLGTAQVAAPASAPLRGAVGLSTVADVGALPNAALGVELDGSLQVRSLRLVALGALFPSQRKLLAGGVGGDFQLALAGLLACLTDDLGRLTLLGCGGGEIGRLSAQGVGVTSSRLGDALWTAGRAEVGAALPVGARLALVARGGVTLPVSRPTFVLDGTTPVHQSGSVTARIALGVELVF